MTAPHHLVIGTSGHIDHGKTTLVKALTGVDADRFEEEKRRGITIDLGFAHTTDAAGNTLALVDVPGHERFVHNMLAGVSGLDAVLLVVAADEGVMPQTREHLAICDLLGVSQGIVVLTRIDRLEDPELADLCAEEVQELVQGTFLEAAPVLPVSSVTGEGIPELKQALWNLHPRTLAEAQERPFRLAVDRSFSVKGFGTVVTGTVWSGRTRLEETLVQYPQGSRVRIRGLQSHGTQQEQVVAGQRAAINLGGVHHEAIHRGDQLAPPESLLNSFMLNVELRVLADAPSALGQRQRVRVHLGTQELLGRLILLEGETLLPGASGLCQLRLEQPTSTRFGDRFIIRSYSPSRTLGGGQVLDPAPVKSRRVMHELAQRLRVLQGPDESGRVEETVYLQALRGVRQEELAVRSGLSGKRADKVLQALQSKQRLLCLDATERRWWHMDHLRRLGQYVRRLVQEHHERFPDREGLTRSELAGKLGPVFSQESQVEALLKVLVREAVLVKREQAYAHPDHQPEVAESQTELLERCLTLLRAGGAQPMRQSHLLEQLGLEEKAGVALLKSASHHKHLIRVAEDLFYPPETLAALEAQMRGHFQHQETLTVIEFKEMTGISRKHAVELLEYWDRQRLTIRRENHRVAGSLD